MSAEENKVDVVIVGGGLTGLTIGYELAKTGLSFRIIEKSNRYGGVIQTIREKGFMYETGPNTGIIGSPELGVLLNELKDNLNVQIGDKAVKRRLILKNAKWQAMPSDLYSAVKTPLYSLKDKIRILGEPFRKRGNNPEETLDQMVLRRMGRSFLNYAVDPFILGVYAGDPSILVTKYAFPKLYNLEQNYGSFIGGTVKKKKEQKSVAEKLATRDVFSLENGLEELVETLALKIDRKNILCEVEKLKVESSKNAFEVSGIQEDSSISFKAKAVISTINATGLKQELFPFLDEEVFEKISKVKYAPTVEIVIGFKKWDGIKLQAFGGLIPHVEKRELLGVLFLSEFLPKRAPEGGALLTCFMGGVRNPKWIKASDEEIVKALRIEFKELMGISDFSPDLLRIIRHPEAIPQYSFESAGKIELVKKTEELHQGFYLAGNVIDGIGIADRVKQGVQIAKRVKDELQ